METLENMSSCLGNITLLPKIYHDVRKVSREDLNILFLKITQQKSFDVPTSALVKIGTYFSAKPECFPLNQDNFYQW